jgi:hypothetical protein
MKESLSWCDSIPVYTKSSLCKEIDKLSKKHTFARKAFKSTTSEKDTDKRSEVSVISDESVIDLEGERLIISGINTGLYVKNPVVYWDHNYSMPPIAKCMWLKHRGTQLLGKAVYSKTDFADTIWTLICEDICKAKSIGYLEQKVVRGKSDERVCTQSLMIEYSCCGNGVNPAALVEKVNKSFFSLISGKTIQDYESELMQKRVEKIMNEVDIDGIINETIGRLKGQLEYYL